MKSARRKSPKSSPAKTNEGIRHRPSLDRMLWIHHEMQADRYPNSSSFFEKFGYKRKTMLRDIAFMTDRLRLPIAYERVAHGYYYEKPVAHFPMVEISERELVALCVAQRSLEIYRGTPFEKELSAAFQKLTENLSDTVTFDFGKLASAVSFSNAGFEVTIDLRLFELLSAAIMARQVTTFEYAKLTGTGYERRKVHPLHLVNVAGIWYLFAHDTDRSDIRRFALVRIKNARRSKHSFERPEGWDPKSEIASGMGIFGGKPETVILMFRGIGAKLMLEHKWHSTQKTRRLGEEELEVRLQVALTPELEGWILRWSPDVEVISPAKLRENVRQKAAGAAAVNGS